MNELEKIYRCTNCEAEYFYYSPVTCVECGNEDMEEVK